MRLHTIITAALITGAIVTTPVASAACDISDTKCALHGNCNIKFRNKTGAGSGFDRGTSLKQGSSAQLIKVKAIKANGSKAGNALTINDGASRTMNMDKKANKSFDRIRISSPALAGVTKVTMGCGAVKAVLNGNGSCVIFNGDNKANFGFQDHKLGYNCDNGKVVGPKD